MSVKRASESNEEITDSYKKQLTTFGASGSGSGVSCDLKTLSGHQSHYDEPEALGGKNGGANPMELLGNALVACQQVMIEVISKEKKIDVSHIDWSVEVDIDIRGLAGDKNVPPEPQKARVKAVVHLPSDQASRLQELQDEVEARCPVLTLYRKGGLELTNDWVVKTVRLQGKLNANH